MGQAEDSATTGGSAAERELARARERLAFYEGFDRLIQENIARSGDLLRQAAEQRETAIREADQTRVELDRRRAAQRETLTGLAEDLLALQRHVGDLTSRVMTAIDDLGANGPLVSLPLPRANAAPPRTLADAAPTPLAESKEAPGLVPPIIVEGAAPPLVGDEAAELPPAPVPPPPPPAAFDPSSPATPPVSPPGDAGSTLAPDADTDAPPTPSDSPPPVATGSPAPASSAAVSASSAEAAGERPMETLSAPPARTEALPVPAEAASAVAVVVHGVPRAAAALSLQRHLAGLPQVEAVEAREYAAGVLRLHVLARRPLALADLRGWEGGATLEPVNVLPDVVEVRLPSSTV